MPDLALSEAERRLRGHRAYGWLLDGQQVWSVAEFIKQHEVGVGVTLSHDAVTRWFRACPHTMNYGGPIGLRATRDDLVRFLAGRMRSKPARATSEPSEPSEIIEPD